MSLWRRKPGGATTAKKPAVIAPPPGIALEPGEETLWWDFAKFATGLAPSVQGRRWFRDPRGTDIEQLLVERSGWPHRDGPAGPPAPSAAVKAGWRDGAATAAEVGLLIGEVALSAAVELAGGISPGGGGRTIGPEKDHLDARLEGDDFPVMVGEIGSMAASAPWQLDPARYAGYRVLLSCTATRLIFTGLQLPEDSWEYRQLMTGQPRYVLWVVPRAAVASAEQRKFSAKQQDAILRFIDGSWVRLELGTSRDAKDLAKWAGAPSE